MYPFRSEKRQIIRTSIALFSQYGYHSVRMKEIAFDTSLSLNALKQHFPTKAAILDGILDCVPDLLDGYEPTPPEVADMLRTQSPRTILRRFVAAQSLDASNNMKTHIYRILFMEMYHNDRVRACAERYLFQQPIEVLRQTLDQMAAQGAIPPGDSGTLAALWVRTALVYSMHASHEFGQVLHLDLHRVTELLIDMAIHGVTPPTIEREPPLAMEGTQSLPPDADILRNRILQAAVELFERDGFDAVTLHHIAATLGVAVGEVYGCFSSTIEVMEALLALAKGAMTQWMQAQAQLRQTDAASTLQILPTPSRRLPSHDWFTRLTGIMISEQFHNKVIRDMMINSFYFNQEAVKNVLDLRIAAANLPSCDSHSVAVVYTYTMASLSINGSLSPGGVEDDSLEQLRIRATALLENFVLHGFADSALSV